MVGRGEAAIKPQFLKPIVSTRTTEIDPKPKEEKLDENAKLMKTKMRGTFKKRPIDQVEDPSDVLCRFLAVSKPCEYGERCKFSHEIKDFMKRKPKDIHPYCPIFESFGECEYGLKCRFASVHVANTTQSSDSVAENVTENEEEKVINTRRKREEEESNHLSAELCESLRKNRYCFGCIQRKDKRKPKTDSRSPGKLHPDTNPILSDEEVAPSPLLSERKQIDFHRKIYVAPLTTVGNLPFRRLLKQTGADITCGEMAMSSNILQAQRSEWALLRRHKSEDVFGVQIAGAHGDQMARVCELLTRETDVDFIDINMGCPIDIVCKSGSGSALMTRPARLLEVISGALTGIQIGQQHRLQSRKIVANSSAFCYPALSVKLRTGWSEKQPSAHKVVSKIISTRSSHTYVSMNTAHWCKLDDSQSVRAIAIHGRSRLQRYTKEADWDYIYRCADTSSDIVSGTSFIGGGDVLSFVEFDEHLKNGKLDTCMVARGALIKPWLPIEIKERRHFDISASERFDLLKDFVKFGLEHWGTDQKGVNRTRRYLLEWQSFLCRYIPVGILEQLPQRINDRPAPYYGRNDLETLMASDQAVDWIKLSELLLGSVPEEFKFVPKHKANAFAASTQQIPAVMLKSIVKDDEQ
uniref:tRNA-dihydrouridine(47) synthase [NAD(P)(+)] n=1 Tax=Albugo laibachii Nc14 TaxID=890382 RepID=F0WPG5_9STRA|nr:tRNAdihydrouridine synthase 3 putative [Albugo laibachii Nc14]|eukprot:CCA23213.1 tRNAdihydrouridine synthase 3 putative [Albugo laibachii Nc14]